tara:strand:- start:258 stop:440 length:183 start_codon:yes stop_codon:yes gene_type:complete
MQDEFQNSFEKQLSNEDEEIEIQVELPEYEPLSESINSEKVRKQQKEVDEAQINVKYSQR